MKLPMHLRRMILLAATGAAAACTPLDRLTPTELLDRRSGDTLVVANQPLVFARERSDVAARARDYATLVAVEADHAGHYEAYLVVHRWSTVDRRVEELPDAAHGALRLLADGRELLLEPLAAAPETLQGSRTLQAPDTSRYVTWVYATDIATLGYLGESAAIALQFQRETVPIEYALWTDGRAAWREFAVRGSRR